MARTARMPDASPSLFATRTSSRRRPPVPADVYFPISTARCAARAVRRWRCRGYDPARRPKPRAHDFHDFPPVVRSSGAPPESLRGLSGRAGRGGGGSLQVQPLGGNAVSPAGGDSVSTRAPGVERVEHWTSRVRGDATPPAAPPKPRAAVVDSGGLRRHPELVPQRAG